MPCRKPIVVLVFLAAAGCTEQSTSPDSRRIAMSAAKSPGPTDPTASWLIPLNDAGLSLRSDHTNGDGAYSVYANGVCGVSTTIFATTERSNNPSGDATITVGEKGRCSRRFTVAYPDGVTESVGSFNNLNTIETPTYAIPIGQTVKRGLVFNPGQVNSNPSRCGTLFFGPELRTGPSVGGDSLLVTRMNDSTWQVESQPAPNDHAYCKANGQLYELRVSCILVASRKLP